MQTVPSVPIYPGFVPSPSPAARAFLGQGQSASQPQTAESDLLKSIRGAIRGPEEELSWDAHNVILSSGGVIRRRWDFQNENQPVQWACFGYLEHPHSVYVTPTIRTDQQADEFQDQDFHIPDPSQRPTFGPFARMRKETKPATAYVAPTRAILIFLRSKGKIFYTNGMEYTFDLPFIRILENIELEESKVSGDPPLPTIFAILNPISEPSLIGLAGGLVGFDTGSVSLKQSGNSKMQSIPAQEHVVWISETFRPAEQLMVTIDPESRRLTVWRYAYIPSKDLPKNQTRPRTAKARQSMSGSAAVPPHARQSSVDPRSPVLPRTSLDLPSLAALPGMPSALANTATMNTLMQYQSTGDTAFPFSGPSKQPVPAKEAPEKAPAGSGIDSDYGFDANDRMKVVFWAEKLYTEVVDEVDAANFRNVTATSYDSRWNGKRDGALIGVCLPSTQTLLILDLTRNENKMATVQLHSRSRAIAIATVQTNHLGPPEMLVVRPDHTLTLMMHGTYELPLHFANSFPAQAIKAGAVVTSLVNAWGSSVTLGFQNGTSGRLSLGFRTMNLLTDQCLCILALVLPSDFFFALHARYLHRWSQHLFAQSEESFEALMAALYDVLGLTEEVQPTALSSLWERLACSSSFDRSLDDPAITSLQLPTQKPEPRLTLNQAAPHGYISSVLCGLHHLAQDNILSLRRYDQLLKLVPVVCKLALHVRPEWADYWRRLFPDAVGVWPSKSQISSQHLDDRLPVPPFDFLNAVYSKFNGEDILPALTNTWKLVAPFGITPSFAFGQVDPLMRLRRLHSVFLALADVKVEGTRKRAETAINMYAQFKQAGTIDPIEDLPIGIAAPLKEVIRTSQLSPSGSWSSAMYRLIGRNDLAEGVSSGQDTTGTEGYLSVKDYLRPTFRRMSVNEQVANVGRAAAGDIRVVSGVELGMQDFMDIRFGQDRRVEEVGRMLCSSSITAIKAMDRPEQSELDQAKEHHLQVIRLAERTLALPIGRALFTFGSAPVVTKEAYIIPKMEFTARIQPQNMTMLPEPGKIPGECISWGEFHNGVAAGLRLSSAADTVESSWIRFNKPAELTPEHAGFLFALGLTGHLREMLTWHTFGYLTPKHELTSIGVLLGLAASHVGSSNRHVTKLIAVHTPALLPTPSVDLNVPLLTQSAGLIGIGLLYMGTKNRRMAEVCITQISRKDLVQPDLSNEYREAYTLCSALAFGMIMLGKGTQTPADADLLMRLSVLVHGEGYSAAEDRPGRPDFDVTLTSPAASMALALMYLKTERQDVADILTLPDTVVALDRIQPNMLLLRSMARALIMWNAIAPKKEWLDSMIPDAINKAMEERFKGVSVEDSFELAYYNIVPGCLFALGLKYAGTATEEAYVLIISYYDLFAQLAFTNGPAFDHRIKRAAIRDGLNLISIALNMVMAGTGELNCFRRLRYSYGMYNQAIRYGTHVANHLSLGLLFLGGGRFTLGTSDAAIACMITAFFPRFPQVSSDSKTYLQALRHLWVLAAEPRCLIARDVDTKEVVYLPVKIKLREDSGVAVNQMISPTLIPDLDRLLSIRVDTPRYWPFYLDLVNIPRHKASLLRSQTLFVKRRTAFLSYMEDPKGSRSLFVRSNTAFGDSATLDFPHLTSMSNTSTSDLHQFIPSFAMDTFYLAFAERFCRDDGVTEHERIFQAYCHAALLDSILQDTTGTVQTHITLHRYRSLAPTVRRSRTRFFNVHLHDLQFLADFYLRVYDKRFSGKTENNARSSLIRQTTLLSVLHVLDGKLDELRKDPAFLRMLHAYAHGRGIQDASAIPPDATSSQYIFAWYLLRNHVPVSIVLALLPGFIATSRDRSLTTARPTNIPGPTPNINRNDEPNVRILDEGIRTVLHRAANAISPGLGSGWSMGSLEEVMSAWRDVGASG
ncbi:Anaphase-promoting complex subunit 1 [Steccherinum ochraceum]|uniref:Anaphase-promoting complex subunit 1 n=1 Tax=Steccherinum ochraceum TaxID=92696 RepID=A0A4R0RTR0_9APHY|nr:Anaphase-promoting complex subunit 1 [Steccherinum ochraceum]